MSDVEHQLTEELQRVTREMVSWRDRARETERLRIETHERLAAANALLVRGRALMPTDGRRKAWRKEVADHLAAQPATAPSPAQRHARLMQHKVNVISEIVEEARARGGDMFRYLNRISEAIVDAQPATAPACPRCDTYHSNHAAGRRVLNWEEFVDTELARRGLKP